MADTPWHPGPWRLSVRDGGCEADVVADDLDHPTEPFAIALIYAWDLEEQTAAARLIVSAPELVERFERTTDKLHAALEMLDSFGCHATLEHSRVRENREFLARIRGRSA